ncbi:hypothetical protein ABTY63_47160, partial [Streptomyces solisilvae]|uniref:hypothetical protein n=1 Tax=Streptomyces malaysiensis TaxID=92644 RepID=UPI0033257065
MGPNPTVTATGGTPGQSTEDPFLRFYVGHVRQAAATEGQELAGTSSRRHLEAVRLTASRW